MTISGKIASQGFRNLLKEEINRLKNSYSLLREANSIVMSTSYNAYSIYIFKAEKETKVIPYNVNGNSNTLTIGGGGNVTIKPFETRGGMYLEIYDSRDGGFEYGTGYSPKAKEFKIDTSGIKIEYSTMCIEEHKEFKGNLDSNTKLKELYDLIAAEFSFKNICNSEELEPPSPEPEPELPPGGGGGDGEDHGGGEPPTQPPDFGGGEDGYEPPTIEPLPPYVPPEEDDDAQAPTNYRIRLYINNVNTGTLTLRNPQLEIGNKMTDWTPAPDDIETTVTKKTAELKVNLDGIRGTVSETVNTVNSQSEKIGQLIVTTNQITNKVSETTNTVNQQNKKIASIDIKTDGISSSVQDIQSTVNGQNSKISRIEQTTSGISSTVQNIQSNVNGQNSKISKIEQTTNNISLSVQDKVGKNNIINSINLSNEGVKIKASKVQIEGDFLVKDDLTNGSTLIKGASIKSGTITGTSISGGTIQGSLIQGARIETPYIIDPVGTQGYINTHAGHFREVNTGKVHATNTCYFGGWTVFNARVETRAGLSAKDVDIAEDGNLMCHAPVRIRGNTSLEGGANVKKNLKLDGERVVVCNANNYKNIKKIAIQRGNGNTYLEMDTGVKDDVWGANIWLSDEKIKDNISLVTNQSKLKSDKKIGLNLIKDINHYTFNYKDDDVMISCGYIAQDLQKNNEQLVYDLQKGEGESLLAPSVSSLIPNITLAIQEQQKQIEELKSTVEEQQKQIAQLLEVLNK